MTARQTITHSPGATTPDIIQFPDRPEYEDITTVKHFHRFGYLASLIRHFGNEAATIITCEVAVGARPTESYDGIWFPDLLIAFGVDPAAFDARNGYLIPEQGKPPDFVMEISSKTTAETDQTDKRNDYAAMGILEYWRFDASGALYQGPPLAGDRLMGDQYEPIAIIEDEQGNLRGHSEALNLDLCWEGGMLRFWNPASQRYLYTFDEMEDAREAAEAALETAKAALAAQTRADRLEQELDSERQARLAERQARLALEERIRQLEQERGH